jgi:hypothetical protein
MSNVSTRHPLKPFTAGDKALSGQRLAKVGYKTSKKTPAKFSSVAVSVPQIEVSQVQENILKLLPYIGTMLENAQDGIIRGLYESAGGKCIDISDDDISVSACIGYMSAEAAGDRLTKDAIESWFDAELSENLFASIAEKLKFVDEDGGITEDQETAVKKHLKVYRDVLSMLAGGKTLLAEKQIAGCKNALALAPNENDAMVARLNARLTAMEKPKSMEELLEL